MAKEEEFITLNGVRVLAWWPEHLQRSQSKTTYKINGKDYLRIAYGEEGEDWGADRGACHDCAALKGQLHAPGCDVERCPVCGEQAFCCNCPYDDADDNKFDFKAHEHAAVSAYLEKRDFYKELASVVQRVIEEALRRRDIKIHSVQARCKDPRSFGKKAAQPLDTDPGKPKYAKPLEQIRDMAGIRIITFSPSTLREVDTMLSEEFEIIERSDNGELLLAEERFGYNSVHYLARLTPTRAALPEYAQFASAVAEVQVRTVLQHAWAEIEHDIQYKSTSVIPAGIRRRFGALAGMLEIADREFQAVQDEDRRLREEARSQLDAGFLSEVEITPDSIKAFLDKALGSDDRMSAFSYDFIARTLRKLGFSTLAQVEECISSYNDDQLSRLAYGTRLGQVSRFEFMVLAGMGKVYIQRHPWGKLDWFVIRQKELLEKFSSDGILVGRYDPASI